MITSVQSLTRIGETLPNGAVLLDRTWTRTEDWTDGLVYHEAVALGLIRHKRPDFVTWVYCLNPEQGEFTVAGNYHHDIVKAVADYEKRIKRHLVTDGPYKPRS